LRHIPEVTLPSPRRAEALGSHRKLADMKLLTELPPLVGIGLKPEHYAPVLQSVSASNSAKDMALGDPPGWLEVHPQNYFGAGGPPHRWLSAIAEHSPISFHSVGLSLGSAAGCDLDELEQLAALCDRYEPAMVSDHLSWSGSSSNRYPDLLPVPYTDEALGHFATQISVVQERLKRRILIENPSRYLAFAGDDMDEVDFLHLLCKSSGCGILLDINNIEVSATNLGLDPLAMIDAIDPNLVGEVHLAGHAREEHPDGPLLIDDHGSAVSDLTWALFARFVWRAGRRPVLIEWDTDVPEYTVLLAEAHKAEAIMQEQCTLNTREPAMLMLEAPQAAMMRALDFGPSQLPDRLFACSRARALTGMKVHANTISHARLVALEDTFPRTRALLGHECFNEHSRRFTGLPGVTARTLALVGETFPGFLGEIGEARVAVDLAVFEWLWLESYHAAEARSLRLGDLAGSDETALLAVTIALHPATRIAHLDRAVHRLIGEEVPGLDDADAILIARPEAEVLVSAATSAMAMLISALTIPNSIGNLFASLTEPECKDRLPSDDFMPALIALLEAGAVTQLGQQEG
jgi:uncharacterized protein (UPF0276 family)